jgi:hypothetical protein
MGTTNEKKECQAGENEKFRKPVCREEPAAEIEAFTRRLSRVPKY